MRLELAGPRVAALRALAPASLARLVEHSALTAIERELAARGCSLRRLAEPEAPDDAAIGAALRVAHSVFDLHEARPGDLTIRLVYEFDRPAAGIDRP